jgi:hypothetical protein
MLVIIASPGNAEAPAIQLVVDGRPLTMDVQPQVIDGRVMIPARALAEALGATVEWDGAGRRVVVKSKEAAKPLVQSVVSETSEWVRLKDVAAQYPLEVSIPDGTNGIVHIAGNGHLVKLPTKGAIEFSGTSETGVAVRGKLTDGMLFVNLPDLRSAGLIP